jgi:hypothetical protein
MPKHAGTVVVMHIIMHIISGRGRGYRKDQGRPIEARVLVLNFAANADVTRASDPSCPAMREYEKVQNQIHLSGRYICMPAMMYIY